MTSERALLTHRVSLGTGCLQLHTVSIWNVTVGLSGVGLASARDRRGQAILGHHVDLAACQLVLEAVQPITLQGTVVALKTSDGQPRLEGLLSSGLRDISWVGTMRTESWLPFTTGSDNSLRQEVGDFL